MTAHTNDDDRRWIDDLDNARDFDVDGVRRTKGAHAWTMDRLALKNVSLYFIDSYAFGFVKRAVARASDTFHAARSERTILSNLRSPPDSTARCARHFRALERFRRPRARTRSREGRSRVTSRARDDRRVGATDRDAA